MQKPINGVGYVQPFLPALRGIMHKDMENRLAACASLRQTKVIRDLRKARDFWKARVESANAE